MRYCIPSLLTILVLTMTVSCSGGRDLPTGPSLDEPTAETTQASQALTRGTIPWGLWSFEWNEFKQDFDIVPLRGAEFACNVIKFMNENTGSISLHINGVDHQADYVEFDLDIGFVHPFPGLTAFTGFDVLGVFMGDGSEMYPGVDGLEYPGEMDQRLLNPDGYTRRFNAPEFTGAGEILPLQGYYPGNIVPPDYVPTARLNPYKYYADWLEADGNAFQFLQDTSIFRGQFLPGSCNFRNYIIRFPNDKKSFNYAIVANWEPNINHPSPPDSLDDFPPNANSEEAVVVNIDDHTNAWYVDDTHYGGAVTLEITPWDWSAECSAVMEEYEITLYSPAWTGAYDVDMTPIAQVEHQCTYQVSIPGSELLGSGDQRVWVEVSYPDFDYTSPVGVPNDAVGALTSYFQTSVHILNYDPTVVSDNFIYGFADSNFFDHLYGSTDNVQLITNLLNLPLTGPYAENNIFMYYRGHTNGSADCVPDDLGPVVEDLGYEWVYVPPSPYVPLDTTGVKMLVLAVYFTKAGELYTPEDLEQVRNLLNGGGVLVISAEHSGLYGGGTEIIDKLLEDLNAGFSFPCDMASTDNPYADITPDPITEDVAGIGGGACGRFEVFGNGVSLIRGDDYVNIYDVVVKSPWTG